MTTRVFFVHVMKTGGVSVSSLMRSQYTASACYPFPLAPGEEPGSMRPVVAKVFIDPLLELSDQERQAIDFYSVHMPAWVAAEVAPHHLTVTVLREPVSRTVSHLRHLARIPVLPDDLDELYDDPEVHGRLVNYQTRLFAESKDDYERNMRMVSSITPEQVEASREALEFSLLRFWATGIRRTATVQPSDLDRAMARLDTIDEVGTTDELPSLRRRLEQRFGGALPELTHRNAAPAELPVSSRLVDRIRQDCALDAALYERARERSAS